MKTTLCPSRNLVRKLAVILLTGIIGGVLVIGPVGSATEVLSVTNPSFEEGLSGWIGPREFTSEQISVDEQVSHSGEASLRICDEDYENPWLAQGIAPLQPMAQYELAAYVRGHPEKRPVMAAVKIEFYDAQNNNISGYYQMLATAVDGSWQRLAVSAPADETVVKAAIALRLLTRGTVWFDDIEFIMTQPPPAIVVIPYYLITTASQRGELGLQLQHSQAPEDLPALHFWITGPLLPEPLEVEAHLERANERTLEAIVKVPELPAGVYELVITSENKEPQGAASLVALPGAGESIGSAARGKTFFPIGLYHVSVDDYAQVAAAGFNCVQGPATDSIEELKAALDAAAQARLKVIVPLYDDATIAENLQASAEKVQEFARHPAVLLWKMVDAPDLRPDIYPEVAKMYLRLQAIPRHQPLQITVANPAQYQRWAPLCDVLEVNPYPLPDKPVQSVGDFVTHGHSALRPGQVLLALLQAGWTADLVTQPTVEQARMMMYLAVMNGADGILWYCLRAREWDLTQTPLWPHFPELNQELATLGQVMLRGEALADIECSEKNVTIKGFRDNDKIYLLLVNDTDQAVEGRLRVPVRITEATWLRTGEKLRSSSRTIRFTLPAQGAETVVTTVFAD